MAITKGIILSGGAGSRLYPLTLVASKQLQPIYDKPMIYYPLSCLMLAGIREFCIISTPHDTPRFKELLGDGAQWGVEFTYCVQPEPKGIAQAFLVGEEFIGNDSVALILGDNIFHGQDQSDFASDFQNFEEGSHIFAYRVKDPERYGVVEFDSDGKAISIEEKPAKPRSPFAIPGLYLYDNEVVEICKNLKPSDRGELEITDVNKTYLEKGKLTVAQLGRGTAWLDTGTTTSLQEASNFIAILEHRQSSKVGCPEEIAFQNGFINLSRFESLIDSMPNCEYADYLRDIAAEGRMAKQ